VFLRVKVAATLVRWPQAEEPALLARSTAARKSCVLCP